MALRIEHRARFDQDIAEVFKAVSDEDAWRARLDAIGGPNARIESYSQSGDQWRFVLYQGVSAEKLPAFVRALYPGDLVVEREQTWEKADEGYTGTVTATVSGIPGQITARTELSTKSGETVLSTDGEVKIRIPLVGGKVEGFVADQVTRLLQSEAEYTARWLADR
ncbi:MAG TPA: DUF2505 domain-containing protein [Amycolatopsis sp.]|uniref:DUF2505 domain-containing protein n=1 Tax=Amycolatopsis sp. TaxID=37632 RepID=UPI002B48E3BB|nr:DUF2505 domain-containing protein [Amycolatopsis sp.]HKS48395.1 DUF2505 domain-containing protein [Amycolatopsis sp.]